MAHPINARPPAERNIFRSIYALRDQLPKDFDFELNDDEDISSLIERAAEAGANIIYRKEAETKTTKHGCLSSLFQYAQKGIAFGKDLIPRVTQCAFGATAIIISGIAIKAIGVGVIANVAVGTLAVATAAFTEGVGAAAADALAKAIGLKKPPRMHGEIGFMMGTYVAMAVTPGFFNTVGAVLGASAALPTFLLTLTFVVLPSKRAEAIFVATFGTAAATASLVIGKTCLIAGKVFALAGGGVGFYAAAELSWKILDHFFIGPALLHIPR